MKAVAFDLDGTLIDSTDAIVESFLHTFDVLGDPPPPTQAIIDTIGYPLNEQFEQFTERDVAGCTNIYRAYYKRIACEKTIALPGARESLEQLRNAGLRLGFVTSKKRSFAEMILNSMGLLALFEVRIGPDDVKNTKPHPEPVLKALSTFGIAPEEMYVVGDTEFDVLSARDAGVPCLCVTTGYDSRDKLVSLNPEAVFDHLIDLTDYILDNQIEE